MTQRLDIQKTYKLYIGGAFPRSESGRSEVIKAADGRVLGHSCRGSRKDLRDAVVAARKAQKGWEFATAYLRGQIMYRMAEMLEAKRSEFVELLAADPARAGASGGLDPDREVAASVDRLVAFAGWTDKFAQALGCQNPVAGPYWNITTPEPVGVVGIVCPAAPAAPALLGLVSLIAPVICAGNTCIAVSEGFAPVVSSFGEVCATSDLPGGVVNLLTGRADELAPIMSAHRDLDALHGANLSDDLYTTLRKGIAENLKRVEIRRNVDWLDADALQGPGWIEGFVNYKTAWHPVGS